MVAVYGVTGYMIMGWTFIDALYQVVITISGVGFDEVQPMSTALLRVFTMSVIGLGMLSVAFTLGSFVQFLTETEILEYFGRHRMSKHIQTLSDHIIVAGFGRLGGMICDELTAREKKFVVIDLSPERAATADARGFLVVTGDATEEKILHLAGIERAKVLVCVMPNDAENVFVTLTARQMCATLVIVSRAEGASTPKKLRQAGADHIVMPAAIGAHRIVSLLTNPGSGRVRRAGDQSVERRARDGRALDHAVERACGLERARRRHQAAHRRYRDCHQAPRRRARVSAHRRRGFRARR